MLRSLLLIAAIVATANAGAVDLNPDNFDTEVTSSGKGAFVKFLDAKKVCVGTVLD